MVDYEVLKLIWWVLIGVLLIGFAIMDGYDIGTANLLPFMGKNDSDRRIMINAIAPHWDGNQVWFITAGGAIFAAWPLVYATAFSGFYWAMILVLFALLIRPAALDYRSKLEDPSWRNGWDWALFVSGIIPSLVFGVAFGNLFQGYEFELDGMMRSHFSGSFWGLLNPFALLCGAISIIMLTMQGAVWQSLRSGDPIQKRAASTARICAIVIIVLFIAAGFWVNQLPGFEITSQIDPNGVSNPLLKTVAMTNEAGMWLTNFSEYPLMMIAPALAFLGAIGVVLLAKTRFYGLTFISSSLTQAGIISTAGLGLFPFILPSNIQPNASLTLWDATSSHLTLGIMTIAAAIIVPVVLGYTLWCFYKMWGRITAEHITDNSHSLY
ncbi:Cytochrome bd-I ubiquinol oxidase subunit 2 [invertebrate metagenome]|uniref:Cytochrome bd-I ubiquinol oxidase subunit 2 n=1 Tax=invertebrate metagenome TaxID=1711999 RepID=A0A2H9T6S5_9ZZZZ